MKQRSWLDAALFTLFTAPIALAAITLVCPPSARADPIAYLVNVTVRPGYNFASAEEALAYGHGICNKIAAGEGQPQLMGDIRADFNSADEYQASYLISQASQELCPQLIWQLRISAAHSQPPAQ
ncbi:MAG: hypothetical protein QOF67_3304 [Mycobacterium sp.]|jgi:hypothetical protein|nr:hypothetical protein [Mycobacterium sp.]